MFASGDFAAAIPVVAVAVTAIAQTAIASVSRMRMRPIEYPLGEVADLLCPFAYGVSCRARDVRYGRGNASDSPRAGNVPASGSPVRPSGPERFGAATIQALSDDVVTRPGAIRQSRKWDFPLPMAYEKIRYEVADAGVATVTLDDPDTRNSLSNQLLGELIEAFEAARSDDSVRCVVLASSHD